MRRSAIIALLLALAVPSPAAASTLPDVSLRGKKLAVTAGFADVGVDYAVTDRLQVGVGGEFTLITASYYARATYRLWDDTILGDIGLHLAGGNWLPVLSKSYHGQFVFFGPVIARRLGSFAVLRASYGPYLTNDFNLVFPPGGGWGANGQYPTAAPTSRSWGLGIDFPSPSAWGYFLPNLELAFPIGSDHELTLGGNAILGWRGRF